MINNIHLPTIKEDDMIFAYSHDRKVFEALRVTKVKHGGRPNYHGHVNEIYAIPCKNEKSSHAHVTSVMFSFGDGGSMHLFTADVMMKIMNNIPQKELDALY